MTVDKDYVIISKFDHVKENYELKGQLIHCNYVSKQL